MDMPHFTPDALQTARALMARYGLRAAAIAGEHAAEARSAGGSEQFDRWSSVALAIAELRQAPPGGGAP